MISSRHQRSVIGDVLSHLNGFRDVRSAYEVDLVQQLRPEQRRVATLAPGQMPGASSRGGRVSAPLSLLMVDSQACVAVLEQKIAHLQFLRDFCAVNEDNLRQQVADILCQLEQAPLSNLPRVQQICLRGRILSILEYYCLLFVCACVLQALLIVSEIKRKKLRNILQRYRA